MGLIYIFVTYRVTVLDHFVDFLKGLTTFPPALDGILQPGAKKHDRSTVGADGYLQIAKMSNQKISYGLGVSYVYTGKWNLGDLRGIRPICPIRPIPRADIVPRPVSRLAASPGDFGLGGPGEDGQYLVVGQMLTPMPCVRSHVRMRLMSCLSHDGRGGWKFVAAIHSRVMRSMFSLLRSWISMPRLLRKVPARLLAIARRRMYSMQNPSNR